MADAVTAFKNFSRDLFELEKTHKETPKKEFNVHGLAVVQEQLKYVWQKFQAAYETIRENAPKDDSIDQEKLIKNYNKVFQSYVNLSGSINEHREALTAPPKEEQKKPEVVQTLLGNHLPAVRLPPCDTDIFHGGYESWPTFRDMFTALYINNTSITSVEKLFHLKQKTRGEAREIIQNAPLTNDGFFLAWGNLCDQYENTRMQINGQLKTLFNLPQVVSDSGSSVKKLQRTVNNCITSLQCLDVNTDSWDPILVYLCSTKLPKTCLQDFENSLKDISKNPTWKEFDTFLTHKYKTLESVGDIQSSSSKTCQQKPFIYSKENTVKEKKVNSFHANISSKPQKPKSSQPSSETLRSAQKHSKSEVERQLCKVCKEQHTLRECPKFIGMKVEEKIETVKKFGYCYNCLAVSHGVKECKSSYVCRHCNKRHHTLLHKPLDTDSMPSTSAQAKSSPTTQTFTSLIQSTQLQSTQNELSNVVSVPCSTQLKKILLGTAMVNVEINGLSYKARALIDSGSEATFISENLRNKIGLPYRTIFAQVTGINQTLSATPSKACDLILCSPLKSHFKITTQALVLKTLTSELPTYSLDPKLAEKLHGIKLADPEFFLSRRVDIIIGSDIYPQIVCSGVQHNVLGSLVAQETAFGWILSGPVPEDAPSIKVVSLCSTIALDNLLTRFWEIEDIPTHPIKSNADQFCENNFKSTTRRNECGRYVVTLPFKEPEPRLIDKSRHIAMAQFLRNEKSLLKRPDIKAEYDKVLSEYLKLGHMKEIEYAPSKADVLTQYYIPHHAVIKPDRVTTKLRVVFNASNSASDGQSLNDLLHSGPILQQDLVLLILKWRLFRFVFNADIEKMYRQILVDPQHTSYQRILFRKSEQDSIKDYELQTVTFGVNCAPYLAIRTLQQLADDIYETHPSASHILKNFMYVDDVLAGAHSIEEAIKARDELVSGLESAGFPLRKWISNTSEILHEIPEQHLLDIDLLNLSENNNAKTLGIRWNAKKDSFFFQVPPIDLKSAYTKREVLSTIAKLFDPAGWLAPTVVSAKIIMQQIWLDKTGWDEILKPLTHHKWKNFVENYSYLNDIEIPRWTQFTSNSIIEFHGFSDASEKAYAASLYIRVKNSESEIFTTLLVSKSRVAPVKTISLPRLELCGAVLLAHLIDTIVPQLNVPQYKSYYWTDSTIVLAWLQKPPCAWNTFVANRVSTILEKVGKENWRHVESHDNPADIASRGCTPNEFKTNSLWWHGPSWLTSPIEKWPISTQIPIETNIDLKPIKSFVITTQEDILDRFSSLPRALRVLSYVFRFIRKSSNSMMNHTSLEIAPEEIQAVRDRLILMSQEKYFPEEIDSLKKKLPISQKSTLLTLNPYLDSKGIIRANGRLTKSPALTFNERHPIILSYHSKITCLLVDFTHLISLHGGNQLVLRLMRCEFWVPKLKTLIKTRIHKCKICVIHKKKRQTQIMAALPPERTILTRPFTNAGVDFTGPFEFKNYTGRACLITKGYVCVFVCFSTKAVHLEPTSDLSTQSFLAAFARFFSRRGCPANLYSDNGTNFVGASQLLKKDRRNFMNSLQSQVISSQSHQNLNWHFIPPGAPHMGGLWEAGVKSFKAHFKKVSSSQKFTFEEIATLLARIEGCLNSRPLSASSENPSDLEPLTPGHFLIGTPLLSPAEPDLSDSNLSTINRWQKLKVLHHNFCKRWKEEYLKELHKRFKWKHPQRNVETNDLVVIRHEHLPPNEWMLGRVVKVYSGSDSRSRVVDIQTQKGVTTRPVTKTQTCAECLSQTPTHQQHFYTHSTNSSSFCNSTTTATQRSYINTANLTSFVFVFITVILSTSNFTCARAATQIFPIAEPLLGNVATSGLLVNSTMTLLTTQQKLSIETNSIQRNFVTSNQHGANDHGRALKRVFLSNNSITCNDNSKAGFYLRKNPSSKKWIVFLEGGWHCYDTKSCRTRWLKLRHLMTSSQWPETRDVGGILSPLPDENPYWHKANHVLVPYCSSDSWSGTRAISESKENNWRFMGALILRQVIADLIPLGLGRVTGAELLLVGSSAGGLGVMLNLDRIKHYLQHERNLQVTVRGISDSGWFLDREPYTPAAVASSEAVRQGWKLWSGQLPEECAKQHAVEPWRCYFGYRLYPTLKSPLFVFQWLFDEAQMSADNVGAPVTPQQWNYIHEMGGALRSSLDNVTAVFAPSCIGHAVLSKRDWVNIKIDEITLPTALRCWEHSTRLRRKRQNNNKLKRSTESSVTIVPDENQTNNRPRNNERHHRHRESNRREHHKANSLNSNTKINRNPNRPRLTKEQREERRKRRHENRHRRLERQRKKRRHHKPSERNLTMTGVENDIGRQILTPTERRRSNNRRNRKNNERSGGGHHKKSTSTLETNTQGDLRYQKEQPVAGQPKRQADNSHVTNRRRSNRAPNVPEKCALRLLERCSWPQCNHSCPSLTNPLTGEEIRFLELLTSFGLDIEAVAAALGVDMHTLNNMDRTELVNLLTQQVS